MHASLEDSVKVQDNQSRIRENFLKRWFSNNLDVMRFFHFLARQTEIPILGTIFLRHIMQTYYHNIHPGSFILPRKEIEAVINKSTALFIDPCICRVFKDDSACDAPLYSCLRINFAAEVREKQTGKSIGKDEALRIVENACNHGLVLSLEHCLRPYQYNICMCCSCCCVPREFRYRFGLDVYKSGPYLPRMDEQECLACGDCVGRCPVSAISNGSGNIEIDVEACLGCGVCEDTCPNRTITIVKSREVKRNERQPSSLSLYLKDLYLRMALIPMVVLFKWIRGSDQHKLAQIVPRDTDFYTNGTGTEPPSETGQTEARRV